MSLADFINSVVADLTSIDGVKVVDFDIPYRGNKPILEGSQDAGLVRVRFSVTINRETTPTKTTWVGAQPIPLD